jgi:hypothetical protein
MRGYGKSHDAFAAIPVEGHVVRREHAVERFRFSHHVGDGVPVGNRQLTVGIDELDRHPCDCFAPHRLSSSRTMSLPPTQGCSFPEKTTRR